ncbi:MAG: GNAT family N-acetyltransferase [Pirellulaceae bacterium]|nr:GNAT family N-acetyltransferase [Pirellulaceae bacterium]
MFKTELVAASEWADWLTGQWNQLCAASRYGHPSSRSEMLRCFQAHFAPGQRLHLLTVRDQSNRLIAGLPMLADGTSPRILKYQGVNNEWYPTGHLLVHQEVQLATAIAGLVEGLAQLGACSIWLDWIPIDRPDWRALIEQVRGMGWGVQARTKFEVGTTRLPTTWSEFESELSKNSRKRVRSEWKKFSEAGQMQLQVFAGVDRVRLAQAMNTVLEIEARSWKGTAGTTIGCRPAARGFYCESVATLDAIGALRLFLLTLDGRPVAFDLGIVGGGVYRAKKVSYAKEYAELSPGHVLNQLVFRHFIESGHAQIVDTVGPMNDANRRWSNGSYRCGRLVLAPGNWFTNATGRSTVTLLRAKAALHSVTPELTLPNTWADDIWNSTRSSELLPHAPISVPESSPSCV